MANYFTAENTEGFDAVELAMLNRAHAAAVAAGWDAKAAADRINNAWDDRHREIEGDWPMSFGWIEAILRRAVNL